jgi:hypothetical protein
VTKRLYLLNILNLNLFLIHYDKKIGTMLKKLTKTDLIMLSAAFLCLVFSEVMWFRGEKQGALFIGLWVPSILGFAVYLKLLKIDNK